MSDRGDSFLREVDEAVRQEHYKKLWDEYGIYALGLAVLVIAGVAAYKGWTYWQERQAQTAGASFSQALDVLDGPDPAKAKDILTSLSDKGPHGYRVLARFQLAAAAEKAAIPTRPSPSMTRSPKIRAWTRFCATIPRSRPLRSD
jgi:hypothetical protein